VPFFAPDGKIDTVLECSVARWLSPKSTKWCHEKLVDPAKNLSQNFS